MQSCPNFDHFRTSCLLGNGCGSYEVQEEEEEEDKEVAQRLQEEVASSCGHCTV